MYSVSPAEIQYKGGSYKGFPAMGSVPVVQWSEGALSGEKEQVGDTFSALSQSSWPYLWDPVLKLTNGTASSVPAFSCALSPASMSSLDVGDRQREAPHTMNPNRRASCYTKVTQASCVSLALLANRKVCPTHSSPKGTVAQQQQRTRLL